ncbi:MULTISPECIES: SufE family protein [Arcobacteraceae]|jgi:cysteine desulfuration protein SufE|uniref:SufE family protein n=9 Tax=root TaxID=1 RepID=A0AAP4PDK8_9BACT|nr:MULTISPECIES: SufE family protein [Arcobacteraceae]ABV66872.1 putative suf regulatory protein [Aliarcobacter butzleri RM4018]AGR76913.1 putative suf regulatory protein [Aliarcobacter butzleri 7h1h]EFU70359.1 Fe-S metabolism associated domain family protein [Aliarcobacter butzleri JV22]KLD96941.1 SUF regulatory protein [Aliarcobacter butzleri L349]KLD99392.1 SUF regulatory protein [Aliarcobacter butzleri L348]
MSTIEQRVEEIKDDLDFFDDELAKYEYIIDLGKKLEEFDEKDKTPENIVHGCTSQVWLTCENKDGKLYFYGTSDAIIVKGLVYMILQIFSGSTIQELKDVDMDIVHELNLSEVITPNRQSGVIGMIKKIKEYALKA